MAPTLDETWGKLGKWHYSTTHMCLLTNRLRLEAYGAHVPSNMLSRLTWGRRDHWLPICTLGRIYGCEHSPVFMSKSTSGPLALSEIMISTPTTYLPPFTIKRISIRDDTTRPITLIPHHHLRSVQGKNVGKTATKQSTYWRLCPLEVKVLDGWDVIITWAGGGGDLIKQDDDT